MGSNRAETIIYWARRKQRRHIQIISAALPCRAKAPYQAKRISNTPEHGRYSVAVTIPHLPYHDTTHPYPLETLEPRKRTRIREIDAVSLTSITNRPHLVFL